YTITDHYKALKVDAVPMLLSPSPTDSTVNLSPLPLPLSPPPSTPRARPLAARPSIRLADAVVPPCCRCCWMRRPTMRTISPTVKRCSTQSSKRLIVSLHSLPLIDCDVDVSEV
ncbi:hypothetical protein PMAYCL1PPCAC_00169, partial [Pristionchus mayeri]